MNKYISYGKQSLKFLIVFLTLMSLAGCKKEDEEIPSYIRMEIDGVKVECDELVQFGGFPSSANPTLWLNILGRWKPAPQENAHIEIELYGFDNTLGTKSFTGSNFLRMSFDYIDSNGFLITDLYNNYNNSGSITFLEINKKYIKGTFECSTSPVGRENGPIDQKHVTKGEFLVKR